MERQKEKVFSHSLQVKFPWIIIAEEKSFWKNAVVVTKPTNFSTWKGLTWKQSWDLKINHTVFSWASTNPQHSCQRRSCHPSLQPFISCWGKSVMNLAEYKITWIGDGMVRVHVKFLSTQRTDCSCPQTLQWTGTVCPWGHCLQGPAF